MGLIIRRVPKYAYGAGLVVLVKHGDVALYYLSCLGPMNISVSVLCGLASSWSDEHTDIGIVRLGLVLVR